MRRLGSRGRFIKRINNRGRILLNEAQATWEMGKALGLVEDGSKENVICKIMELEENDERQYEKMKGASNT